MKLVTLLLITISAVNCLILEDDNEDLVLTAEEKKALDKFKAQVMPVITEDFMKTDFYLIRWLRSLYLFKLLIINYFYKFPLLAFLTKNVFNLLVANFDITGAQQLLQRNIRWRKNENISNILSEDFSDIVHDYPMTIGTSRDKMLRPVSTCDLGDWDLRGAILQGRQKRLQRYLIYSLEEGLHAMLKAQQEAIQKNVVVTQGMSLIDLEGGNVLQHLCPRCLSIMLDWLNSMEFYYPRFVKEVIMINAPRVTAIGLNAMKPVMSQETKRSLRLFDTNKEVWMKYLDERIDRSQRYPRYGGTKKDV